MIARFAPLALLLSGCVAAAVPAGGYLAGAATTAAATYLGDATFDYAGRRISVEQMTCPELQAAYAQTVPRQSLLVNRWTDWLTTRGMMEDQAEDLDCPLAVPEPGPDPVPAEAAALAAPGPARNPVQDPAPQPAPGAEADPPA